MASFLLVHHHGSKMLRSESNSSITQSPIGWQISHFLSLLHDPTCGMCVCTSECVLLVSACSAVAACVWALIVNGFLLKLHSPSSVSRWCFFFMHALVCVSHITRCHCLCGIGESSQLPFFSLSTLTSGLVSRSVRQSEKVVFYKVLRGFWEAQWQ